MLQEDSIAQEQIPAPELQQMEVPAKPRHPYQVLRMLPKDATPAQQDSAIQATFQPKEIRYSQRPDTLHLPGHGKGKSLKDVSLPQYYRESFFSNDSLFHPELNGGRYGVAGDPVPYTIRTDNTISTLLVVCFIMAVISISNSRRFILRQAKSIFYVPKNADSNMNETSNEIHFQVFMMVFTSLLFAILQYFYTQHYIDTTFILPSQYYLIGIFFAMNVGYFLLKGLLYTCVNNIFFGSKKNGQWLKTQLFVISTEGVALFPLVMLEAYFDLSMRTMTFYVFVVLFLLKTLTFYKAYLIFFRRIHLFLQIILYFCALEIVPMLAFWGTLVMTGNQLKINY